MNEQSGDGRKGDDDGRVKPVVDLPAIEHEFEAAERQRDQREADPIDL